MFLQAIHGDAQNFLANYFKHWISFKSATGYLDNLFSYLNTQHLKKNRKTFDNEKGDDKEPILEIKDLCIYIWQHKIIVPSTKQLVDLLMEAIKDDRLGKTTNEEVIKGVIHSFADVEAYKQESLQLYQETFEKLFIKATGEWYKVRAEQYRNELDCSEYMKKVLQIIDLETLRCTKLLHSSSKDKVISEIRTRMVADHSAWLHEESEQMVRTDRWSDLQAVYQLLKPIDNGLKTIISQVQNHIIHVGLDVLKEVANSDNPPKKFVESFINVHKKYSELVDIVFVKDQIFVSALDRACSTIINHRIDPHQPCRSPEFLAKYCDSLLRKPGSNSNQSNNNNKTLTDSEIDDKLTQSIIVFKYLDDKDVFQKFYSKNMARRLILSQMASMMAEESMINKLRQVCGFEFTSKINKMYTDIDMSGNLKKDFLQNLCNKSVDLGIDFTIYVLQAGSWPFSQSPLPTCILPKILDKPVEEFEQFYYKKFNGRKLTWLHPHCTADVKLCYASNKPYLVTMQTFHLAILVLFEKCDVLTYEQISKASGLSDEQLNKHLVGLVEVKILIYIEDTSSAESSSNTMMQVCSSESNGESEQNCYKTSSKFQLNLDFVYKKSRFKITIFQRDVHYQQTREIGESEQTHSSVDEDRKLYIQAAIVRVMKSRKVAKHNQLVQEVISLTKSHFSPSVPMIKRCIEILIEKQYLERKANVTDEYAYLA